MTTEPSAVAAPPDGRDLILLALAERLRGLGGTQVAPTFAADPLNAALDCYLELRDDEALLAILRAQPNDPPGSGCALTTRRVYWPGKLVGADEPGPPDAERCPGRVRPPLRRSLPYVDLPGQIGRTGGFAKSVDLGPRRRVVVGFNEVAQDALVDFLRQARTVAVGDGPTPEVAAEALERAGRAWPAVVAADAAAKSAQSSRRDVRLRLGLGRAGRVVVTPALVAACVGVYLAMMVVVGGPGGVPSNESMVNWGAVFGPSIVLDGQPWRLFTAMFLHFGPVHLAMNLWCLVGNGPAVERLFGHWAFVAIYVLSGLGASIASLWAHPTFVCAGASGAIFGVLGALLGFVVRQRRKVPAELLRPLHSGAGAFLFYNLIFGLADPQIDKAAHLGGLATGFVAGLLLTPGVAAAGLSRSARRPALAAAMAVGLGLLARFELGHARAQIEADPAVGGLIRANQAALKSWNDFNAASGPTIAEFDAIEEGLQKAAREVDRDDVPPRQKARDLDDLSARVDGLKSKIAALPAGDPEIRAMRDCLEAARSGTGDAVGALKRFLASPGPATNQAFNESIARYTKAFQDYAALRAAYFRAHDLTPEPG